MSKISEPIRLRLEAGDVSVIKEAHCGRKEWIQNTKGRSEVFQESLDCQTEAVADKRQAPREIEDGLVTPYESSVLYYHHSRHNIGQPESSSYARLNWVGVMKYEDKWAVAKVHDGDLNGEISDSELSVTMYDSAGKGISKESGVKPSADLLMAIKASYSSVLQFAGLAG